MSFFDNLEFLAFQSKEQQMNIIDKTDDELLKIGIPWWEDLIKYSNKGQYGKFIRNFSYDLLIGLLL